MKSRKPQDYSPEEFGSVVAMIQGDADLRADIEAITGQKVADKSPRELFDLFRAIQGVTQVQAVVVQYGQARRALKQTRAELAEPIAMPPTTAQYVEQLQAKVDEERTKRLQLEAALKQATAKPGLVAVPSAAPRKAVG